MAITAEAQKSWKGKEWFTVISPKMFGERPIGETPTLDPDSIVNRVVETSMVELANNMTRYYLKLKFRVVRTEGNNAFTRFDGLECMRDYIMRMSQRRTMQVNTFDDFTTKDNWKIRIKATAIMNRHVTSSVKLEIRKFIFGLFDAETKKKKIDELLKDVIDEKLQRQIKHDGSKTYPIRIAEVKKIDVLSAPE